MYEGMSVGLGLGTDPSTTISPAYVKFNQMINILHQFKPPRIPGFIERESKLILIVGIRKGGG